MAKELKTFVLNMKSLDQQIPSPILVGAGDANGRTFRIIFTQEAADMFTPPNQGLSKMVSSKKTNQNGGEIPCPTVMAPPKTRRLSGL